MQRGRHWAQRIRTAPAAVAPHHGQCAACKGGVERGAAQLAAARAVAWFRDGTELEDGKEQQHVLAGKTPTTVFEVANRRVQSMRKRTLSSLNLPGFKHWADNDLIYQSALLSVRLSYFGAVDLANAVVSVQSAFAYMHAAR